MRRMPGLPVIILAAVLGFGFWSCGTQDPSRVDREGPAEGSLAEPLTVEQFDRAMAELEQPEALRGAVRALQRATGGTFVLQVLIDTSGRPVECAVIDRSNSLEIPASLEQDLCAQASGLSYPAPPRQRYFTYHFGRGRPQ